MDSTSSPSNRPDLSCTGRSLRPEACSRRSMPVRSSPVLAASRSSPRSPTRPMRSAVPPARAWCRARCLSLRRPREHDIAGPGGCCGRGHPRRVRGLAGRVRLFATARQVVADQNLLELGSRPRRTPDRLPPGVAQYSASPTMSRKSRAVSSSLASSRHVRGAPRTSQRAKLDDGCSLHRQVQHAGVAGAQRRGPACGLHGCRNRGVVAGGRTDSHRFAQSRPGDHAGSAIRRGQGEIAAVAAVGSFLCAAFLVPPQRSGVLDVGGYRALRVGTVASGIWAVCAALLIPLTISDVSGQRLVDHLNPVTLPLATAWAGRSPTWSPEAA